ncbi:MAG: putative secreted protein [uncultured Nocardioidaceae bacterium]|uniref:Putative secreted protein n=1 Tax=uncultured Nocardioidaceae bacterium TaxID=253824 RepID=A0A6J4LUR7_9ACTN|nr:MAG: putative secreted protein [uncultured Nocardioidaceae bacterium]
MNALPPLRRLLAGSAGLVAAGLAYSVGYERTAFTLRRVEVPVLAPGSRPLRLLHLSDLHMTPGQRAKQRWLAGLTDLQPDLVVHTGDHLASPQSVPVVLRAYGGLLDRPGVFVFGSNDYFAPVLKNPARYLLPAGGKKRNLGQPLPWRPLRDALTERGWVDLTNRRTRIEVDGRTLGLVGVDDPHLRYDDLAGVAAPAPGDVDLSLGVAHAPYLRVLDQWNAEGWQLILAGHTHGGQLRVPGYGALVTNCDLNRSRARGLHQHSLGGDSVGGDWVGGDPVGGDPAAANAPSWLHVSAGLGTSPFAPVRFCCRPEATLLTLVGR